jgi:hypothetical protein
MLRFLTIKRSTEFHGRWNSLALQDGTLSRGARFPALKYERARMRREKMGRYALLWLLGVPIPILLLIWAFGGLN